jgi:ribonuclease-3
MSETAELESLLGYKFRSRALLALALTHPSFLQDLGASAREQKIRDNQRLEFLGDAVLGLVLARWLYERFPDVSEGPLTKARASLVNATALAIQARRINLGEFLLLSRSEEASGGRDRLSNLGDAFESVLGAIYLDGGYEPARDFVLRVMEHDLNQLTVGDLPMMNNPKGELQEMLQMHSQDPVLYKLESTDGPAHQRVFECSVHHRGEELGRGKGSSKKVAETEAAIAALAKLKAEAPAAEAAPVAKKKKGR